MVQDYQENYITGWIKLYRSFINWEWFTAPNMAHFFIYCLLKANHKDNSWRGIKIERGSFITSLETMVNETGLTHQKVRTCIKNLKKTGELNTLSNKQHTIVTICNYDTYQQFTDEANIQTNKQITNSQQTPNKRLTTNNNDKEYKEVYSVTDFYKDWNSQRTKYTHKPSHLNRLTYEEKEMFSELCSDLENPKKEINDALIGFFRQATYINGMDLSLNVKHFLKSYTTYYQAYHDKNPNVWGKNE